jgi:hypothetical protein
MERKRGHHWRGKGVITDIDDGADAAAGNAAANAGQRKPAGEVIRELRR